MQITDNRGESQEAIGIGEQ